MRKLHLNKIGEQWKTYCHIQYCHMLYTYVHNIKKLIIFTDRHELLGKIWVLLSSSERLFLL